MSEFLVTFDLAKAPVLVPSGTLLSEAARMAGVEITQPCGGQGRCGRCIVCVQSGDVRRRSTLRLSNEDLEAGYALACQTVVEGDVQVIVPPQAKIERRLTSDRTVGEITVPSGYNYRFAQTIQRARISLSEPSMDDQTDDLSRLRIALRQQAGFSHVQISLSMLRRIGEIMRAGEWNVTAILDVEEVMGGSGLQEWLIDLQPGHVDDDKPRRNHCGDDGSYNS